MRKQIKERIRRSSLLALAGISMEVGDSHISQYFVIPVLSFIGAGVHSSTEREEILKDESERRNYHEDMLSFYLPYLALYTLYSKLIVQSVIG
ncbi:hypothetical protein ACFL0X_00220 [Nanoarchaeota archaeon]